jgi:hypothetical protein
MENEIWGKRKFRIKVKHMKKITDKNIRTKFLVYANNYWDTKNACDILEEYLNFEGRILSCVLIKLLENNSRIRLDVLLEYSKKYAIYTELSSIGYYLIVYGTIDDARILYNLLGIDDFGFMRDGLGAICSERITGFASKPVFRYIFQLILLGNFLLEPKQKLIEDIICHEHIKREDVIWMAKNLKCNGDCEINAFKVARKYNSEDFALIMDWIRGVNNMKFDS